MSFRKDLIKNVIVLGGYSYSTQILSFLSSIVLARLLLPAEYGFVALITVFTGFISQFSDAGLSYIIIRSNYNQLFFRSVNYLAFLIGTGMCLVIIALAYPIAWFYKDHALILPTIIMSLNFVLRSFITVPYGILSKELKFNSLGFIDFLCTIVEIVSMITLAYFKFSYWSLIFPGLLGSIIRIYMYYSRVDLKFKFMSRKYLVVGFRKSKSIIGNLAGFNLINYWARNTDNLLVGKYYGSSSLGIYDRAYKILGLAISVMTGLFGKVLYPSLKKLSDTGGDVNVEYHNTMGIISILSFPLSVLLIFFPEPLVRLLWSDTWIKVAELLPYIGILILTQTINSTTGNIFILYNKEKTLMWLGFPTNIIIIGSIALGAFYSMTHILRFYTLAYVAIDIPLVLYYGFKKTFGFPTSTILKFWLPKLALSTAMVFSIWMLEGWVTIILMGLYLLHLIVSQKDDIFKSYGFIRRKANSLK